MTRKKKEEKEPQKILMYDFQGEKVVEIETKRIRSFVGYKVLDDESMRLLTDSIRKNEIITPLFVMPTREWNYKIIYGHRHKYCADVFGLEKVPVIIRTIPDEDSIISMVDSNLQRQSITYSEKAFAYKNLIPVFIDYENVEDFSDDNTIIYGHHMASRKMFASLIKYADQSYYEDHPVMNLTVGDQQYQLEIFSGYVTTADSSTYRINCGSKHNFEDARYVVHGRIK